MTNPSLFRLNDYLLVSFLLLISILELKGQNLLKNGSFETGVAGASLVAKDWYSCGTKGYTPPNLHNTKNITPIFKVYTLAQDGEQFISLVTRANQSVECVGQIFERNLISDSTYHLEIYLNSSESFESRTSIKSTETASFNTAADLEVYGLTNTGQYILLDVYEDIKHYNWKKYTTTFQALKDFAAIEFRAYFTFDQLLPYNGHILIDNITLSRL